MSLRIHFLSPNPIPQPRKSQPGPLPVFPTHITTARIRCIANNDNNNSITDADLASDFATQAAKINTQLMRTEEAMKKSKELLFTELCQYLDLAEEEELKRKWRKMDQDEKWVLVKGFVNEWGANFQPLSARSVKEMVEEYVDGEKPSSSSLLFPGLNRLIG